MPPNKKEGEDYPGKGGDYGWLNANSQFVEPFKNAGLDHKKGDILVVESNFGFHIIEVLDSKGSQKKVEVATIERKMEASSKTMQAIFLQASEFAGKNTTEDLFEKAIIDNNKLIKRVVDNVKENDKIIAGIESARPLIRWTYETKKGVVSEPKEFGNKYVVAVVTDIREKGFATLEQVKDDVTAKVIKEKKAELFTTEFNTAMVSGASIDAIASKLKLGVSQVQNINFNSNSIQGVGNEAGVIGAISVQKANTLSKPLKGKEGVFLVYTESVITAPAITDYTTQQKIAISQLQPRVDYEVYDALKINANIVEHLVKYY
jgi:peptidyl-prolyl cis-trans isomerase D